MSRFRVALVSVPVLVLAACGGGPTPTPSPTGAAPSGEPSASPSPTAHAEGFEPDAAAASLGAPAPVAIVNTGAIGLYLRDMTTGTETRVDSTNVGVHGYMLDAAGDVSWDGSQVAFDSFAPDIVGGDTNDVTDVFVRAMGSGAVARLSEGAGGQANEGSYGPQISEDGSTVAFESQATNLVGGVSVVPQVYVASVASGQVTLASKNASGQAANAPATHAGVSAGGRYVVFASAASNLVPGDANGVGDVFVLDTTTGEVELVSVATDGTQGTLASDWPSISADGRYVAFESEASNLVGDDTNGQVDVFVHDRQTGETTLVSRNVYGQPADGQSVRPIIARDGSGVAFVTSAYDFVPGDSNGFDDVYFAVLATGEVFQVSIDEGITFGAAARLDGIYGGRYVVISTTAPNYEDFGNGAWKRFVYDLDARSIERVR